MQQALMIWKSKLVNEEFLFGFFVPIIIILLDWFFHMFGFLYYFFPVALVIGLVFCLITKRWSAALGILVFIGLSFLVRSFFPAFWSWIAADGEILRRMGK